MTLNERYHESLTGMPRPDPAETVEVEFKWGEVAGVTPKCRVAVAETSSKKPRGKSFPGVINQLKSSQ
jgi:hypothetical protein